MNKSSETAVRVVVDTSRRHCLILRSPSLGFAHAVKTFALQLPAQNFCASSKPIDDPHSIGRGFVPL